MSPVGSRARIGVGGLELGPREKHYVNQVLESNRLSYGPFSEQFENEFAEIHDCQYAVFCNSGTSALHIAVAALKETYGWEDGDEILVPAMTFIATSNVVLHNRMAPVFVDVDPITYNLDPQNISKHVTPRTRAIIPVHLFGLPCSMDPIRECAEGHGLRIIEDSCETMFARYQGQSVGSFGDIGCFSTYVAHLLVTGVGGLATTNDPDLAVLLKSLMNHGRDSIYLKADDDVDVSDATLFDIAARRFSFVHLGHSFRATELEAAIGLGQLEGRAAMLQKRQDNARLLTERLQGLEDRLQLPTIPPDRDHVFMMYPLVLRDEEKKPLVNYLEQNGIETRDMLPLVNQPIYQRLFGQIEDQYPVAQWINRSGLYVGVHQQLGESDIQYMADTIQRYFI